MTLQNTRYLFSFVFPLQDNLIPSFSIVLMATMSMITALCVLVLPDTRKTAQPQDTNDLREILKMRWTWKKTRSGQDNYAYEGDTKL